MKKLVCILSFFIILSEAFPQKVGLVLSGGGPRGVTHIGVLKALEEEHIPIDYIVGTSMGAIIGGLYASGYTPEEIEQMMTSEDLLSWLSGRFNPNYYYYFRQINPTASWQIFKITYDSLLRAQLPTNIVSPYEMDFGFMELFSGVSAAAGNNFDSLLVPFRCIASDIASNQAVVLKSGQVGKAIRASMTFPFYFKPVRINGKLMFDGGMYNNFPVDALKSEFHPDVIIGVKAASNYGPPDENDIISQIQSMLMSNTVYQVDPDSGILIEPQLWSVNITDFSNTKVFIDSGYVATKKDIVRIKELVNRRTTDEDITAKRNAFRKKIPKPEINDIRFTGITLRQESYLRRLIKKEKFLEKLSNNPFSNEEILQEIKDQYFRLLAEEQIESIQPWLIYDPAVKGYNVIYDITKSNLLEAELGGLVSSRAINEIFFQLKYNRWRKNTLALLGNAYLGRFHNSGHINARLDVPFNIPLALELSYTLNGWNYFRTDTYFFEDEDPGFLIQQDNFWSFSAGAPISKAGKISAQFQAGRKKDEYYQTNQFSRLDTADVTFFDFVSPGIVLDVNTQNRKQYASRGYRLHLCGRYIAGDEKNIPGSTSFDTMQSTKYHKWLQIRLKYDGYFPLSERVTLGVYSEAALSRKSVFSNYTSTILSAPAFEPLPESKTIFLPNLRAHNFAGFGLKLVVPIINNLDLRVEGYAFQPFKEIRKTESNEAELGKEFDKRYFITSGRFVFHAPFGPITAGLDYYENAEDPYYFNINIGYYIFNKRPFE
ncbi:MAG: patatin-like phospholipase family protein [Bacteroidales bacterium]|nr:patatin-like phospholipase family protein [Bacteroidales bacterium]